MCTFKNLALTSGGHVVAPTKLLSKISLSLDNKSKLYQVKMSLHKHFQKDIFIYKEYCLGQNSQNIIHNEYEISNTVSKNSSYVMRILKSKHCDKIIGSFSHQTQNWLEALIIPSEDKIPPTNIIAKNQNFLLKNRISIDDRGFGLNVLSAVLRIKLENSGLHLTNGYYSMDVFIKHTFDVYSK